MAMLNNQRVTFNNNAHDIKLFLGYPSFGQTHLQCYWTWFGSVLLAFSKVTRTFKFLTHSHTCILKHIWKSAAWITTPSVYWQEILFFHLAVTFCCFSAEVCFEQIDEIDTGDFKYVGPGHGTYEQVTFIPEAWNQQSWSFHQHEKWQDPSRPPDFF